MTLSALGLLTNVRDFWLSLLFLYLAFFKTAQLLYGEVLVFPFISCLQNLHSSMTIIPSNIWIFPVFLAVSATDKPVNRNIHAHPLKQLNVSALRGFIFRDIHKKTRKEFEEFGLQNTKKYVAGKYSRALAPLARKYTNRIFESKNGTTIINMVNQIERQIFVSTICLPSSIVLKYRLIKQRNELLGHPVNIYISL